MSNLTALDWSVLAAALAALVGIGWIAGGRSGDTGQYFLGARKIPGWAAGLSFVATEVSAVTLISVPAIAYSENWQYAQFFIGSTLARVVIAYLFIPAFYAYNCTTIYEFLRHRFGPATHLAGTVFFFITRLLGSGVRLTAAALAVSVLFGWNLVPTLAIFTLIAIGYIIMGGIRAVIWTGVLQAVVFILAGLASIEFILSQVDGGIGAVRALAGEAGRLSLWNLGPSWGEPGAVTRFFKDPNILWIAVLNGFLGSMAAFGTDHELMQRLLTVETRRSSQRTMLVTPFLSFGVLSIFLTVGTCLFTYFAQHPELARPEKLDQIFPHFINTVMPSGLRGLLLAAIVLASIDSPLASLSASFVTDIYRPLMMRHIPPSPPPLPQGEGGQEKSSLSPGERVPEAGEGRVLMISRISVVVFAVILAVLAWTFSHGEKLLWWAFKIGGVTFGSLLGVFLLGLLTKRQADRANVAAMVTMAATNAGLLVMIERGTLGIGWTWLILIGTAGTMMLSRALSPVMDF